MSKYLFPRNTQGFLSLILVLLAVLALYRLLASVPQAPRLPSQSQSAQLGGIQIGSGGSSTNQDLVAPSTSITYPANNATLSGTVTVTAIANDNIGVSRVELWKDSSLFSTRTSSPYHFNWNTTADSNSAHTLQTRAYDAAGNLGQSSVLTVQVSNDQVPPDDDPPPNNGPSSDPNNLANGSSVTFVDKNNPNCSNSHSRNQALNPQTPWCGLSGLIENSGVTIRPGDTVYFRQGDYAGKNIQTVSSGTANARITLKPYPGESVTLRGSSTGPDFLLAFGGDYITVEGFTIIGYENTPQGRLYIPNLLRFSTSRGIELRNLVVGPFQGTDDIGYGQRWPGRPDRESWGIGIDFDGVSDFRIRNVKVTCQLNTGQFPYFRFSGDGVQIDRSSNGVVENSEFYDCGHINVVSRFNSNNVIIQNNTFSNVYHTPLAISTGSHHFTVRNNVIRNYNFFPSESTLRANGIQILGASDNLIYNNIIYNAPQNGSGISVSNSQDENFAQANNNKIFHNTIYSTGYNGISIGNNGIFGSNNWVNNNQIKNNIIYGIQQYADEGTILHGEIRLSGYDFQGNNGYGNVFENNIIKDFNASTKPIYSRNNRNTAHYRYSVSEFNALPFARGNIEADPKFVNPGSGNFSLQPSSPAINAAPCLPEVALDFSNRSRALGGGCTIGAFELDLANPPPPPAEDLPPEMPPNETEDGQEIATSTEPVLATPVCGNGVVDPGEQCDGNVSGLLSCSLFGFLGGGSMRCYPPGSTNACRLDVQQCLLAPNQTNPPITQTNPPPSTSLAPLVSSGVSPTARSSGPVGCQEHWLCRQSWSSCVEGIETRECFDLNHCGTDLAKPATSRACVAGDRATGTKAVVMDLALGLTTEQTQALYVLVPAFFAALLALIGVIIRRFML